MVGTSEVPFSAMAAMVSSSSQKCAKRTAEPCMMRNVPGIAPVTGAWAMPQKWA